MRVGVLLLGVCRPIAVLIALALLAAMPTSARAVTPQVPPLGEAKNLRPQLTFASVAVRTMLSAAVTWSHFEHPAAVQFMPVAGSCCIDPDLSSTTRMSGGSFA